MKFAIAILALLAVASPLTALQLPASGSGALARALQSWISGIPFDKVVPTFMLFAANEKDVHAALQILQSNEFKLFVQDVEAVPDVKNLLNYTQEAGLDVRTLINKLTEVLDLDHISPLEASSDAETLPELKNLLKYVQEPGVDNITLQNRLNEYLNLDDISEDYEGQECVGFSRLYNAVMSSFPYQAYEPGKIENFRVLDDFRRECSKVKFLNVYLSLSSIEHYVKLLEEVDKAGINYAECEDYDSFLMILKIALALAL